MVKETTSTDRRAQHVAAGGFFLQTIACGALIGLSIWSKSDSIATLARFVATGIPVWAILYLVFKQLGRVANEQLETNELKRARQAGTSDAIFELDDEALLVEQNKLRWMIRILLPATTILIFLYLTIGHFIGWSWTLDGAFESDAFAHTDTPIRMMWCIVFIGLVSFLYSCYSIALSRMPNWRLLRAGATFMGAIAIACLALAISLMASESFPWAEPLFGYVVRTAMFILGIEFLANFVMDFYRPRTPGVVPRPSFDSRLLGLVGEPGGVAKSIADTINYQFGFEVSSTWFYKLLQRCLFPLMIGTCLIVLLMSSIVVVNADEQVIVERWGQPIGNPPTVLNPGLHLKYPYPIDIVYRAPVRRVQELVIGEAANTAQDNKNKAIVWTEVHDYVPEMMLLVASPQYKQPVNNAETGKEKSNKTGDDSEFSKSVAVSLLMVSVPIEYRIKDLDKYLYTYTDPEKVMKQIAYQFLSDYAAGVDIDQFMGPARTKLNADLWENLQRKLDEMNTGIEIVFAGIRGAHPTSESQVASAYLDVITAQTTKNATINAAEGEAHKILTAVAGTSAQAKTVDEAILEYRKLETSPGSDPDAVARAKQRVNDLLMGNPLKNIPPLSGQASKLIADARAAASKRIADAAGKVRIFTAEVAAHDAAPTLYMQRKALERFSDIGDVRKYVIVGDPKNVIIEYETEQKIGLDQVLTDNKNKK